MKNFEVSYKQYFHEQSHEYVEYVEAETREEALQLFAVEHEIESDNFSNPENWQWDDGDWLSVFRFIKEVHSKPCPHCDGTGRIAVGES